MLEGKRATVGLIQTRGFGDTLPIMRGFKSLGLDEDAIKRFRSLVKQELVVPKQLIAEVTERVDYQGRVVLPLDEDDARRAVRELPTAAPRSTPSACCGASSTTPTSGGSRRSSRRRRRALWSRSRPSCCRAWASTNAR